MKGKSSGIGSLDLNRNRVMSAGVLFAIAPRFYIDWEVHPARL
jgi:hypothetical protein